MVTALVTAAAVTMPGSVAAAPSVESPAAPATTERPNFIIVQTDDMTVEDLEVMPSVRRLIGDAGATMEQMLTPFALCCPSRASMMTGSYPHNTKVSANFPPEGGFVPWERNNGQQHTA